jgi:hypothetical protein
VLQSGDAGLAAPVRGTAARHCVPILRPRHRPDTHATQAPSCSHQPPSFSHSTAPAPLPCAGDLDEILYADSRSCAHLGSLLAMAREGAKGEDWVGRHMHTHTRSRLRPAAPGLCPPRPCLPPPSAASVRSDPDYAWVRERLRAGLPCLSGLSDEAFDEDKVCMCVCVRVCGVMWRGGGGRRRRSGCGAYEQHSPPCPAPMQCCQPPTRHSNCRPAQLP